MRAPLLNASVLLSIAAVAVACSGAGNQDLFDESNAAAGVGTEDGEGDGTAARPSNPGGSTTSTPAIPSAAPTSTGTPAADGGSPPAANADAGTAQDANVPDPVKEDAAVDSGVVTDSAGPQTATAVCYDQERLKNSYKECGSSQDCDSYAHLIDCCGTMVIVGHARSKTADILACEVETARLQASTTCSCSPRPMTAEDGNTVTYGNGPGSFEKTCSKAPGASRGLCKTRKRN